MFAKILLTTTLLFTLSCFTLTAQNSGDNIFDASYVHEVKFEFSESNYLQILRDNYEGVYDPLDDVPYLMAKVTIDDEVVDSIGIRFKGFTSYNPDQDKNPIKIDFNEFVPGKRFDGLRKLNLNNGTGDPAMQRDVVCYDLMRSTGVNAPRTGYARVYFNNVYWGLYQLIEQVDKEFIQNNFKNDNGNLFKNKGWSFLEYQGNSKSDYDDTFQLKTNKDEDDWSGFINFIEVLNNSSEENFPKDIQQIFDVDLFLKTLAIDVATNNWDSYLQHGRNYYIYEDTDTGIFSWIPWDYNFALGGSLGGGKSQEDCFVFASFAGWTDGTETVTFIDASFATQEASYSWDFGDGNTSTEKSPVHTYAMPGTYDVCLKVFVDEECEETRCDAIDTEYDYSDCPSLVGATFTDAVSEAFVLVNNTFPECCNIWGENCQEFYDRFSGGGFGGDFDIDQRDNSGVLIKRLLSVPEFNFKYNAYFCELLENQYTAEKYDALIERNRSLIEEAITEDPNYLFTLEDFDNDSGPDGLRKQIATRLDSLNNRLPALFDCETIYESITFQEIVINEIAASNDSTSSIFDLNNEHDDWIELYNNTDRRINLSGLFLSNDENELNKWALPIGTFINPDSYLIIWADDDEEQAELHTNFKLSKSGSKLFMSNNDGTMMDELEYGQQETNITLARIPNGTGDFINQDPTFNGNNEFLSSVAGANTFKFQVYPNPVADELNVQIQDEDVIDLSVRIISLTGRQITSSTTSRNDIKINTSSLAAGFYTLVLEDRDGHQVTSKFIKK